jgi:hypothetical protein
MWKTCARAVDIVCITIAQKNYRRRSSAQSARAPCTGMDAVFPSLDRSCARNDNVPHSSQGLHPLAPAMHRPERVIEHQINGRLYRIEVALVSRRWRARVVNAFGGPTAMMPFYGATAEDAAQDLSGWLARAHRHPEPPASK